MGFGRIFAETACAIDAPASTPAFVFTPSLPTARCSYLSGHGKTLFEAAAQPKQHWWVDGAGHDDLVWVTGDRYAATLRQFVHQWIATDLPV